jgi:hypothetical protein
VQQIIPGARVSGPERAVQPGVEASGAFLFGGAMWEPPTPRAVMKHATPPRALKIGEGAQRPVAAPGLPPAGSAVRHSCASAVRSVTQRGGDAGAGDATIRFGSVEVRLSRPAAARLAQIVALADPAATTLGAELRLLSDLLETWSA